jgi:hypothetical protein
VRTDWDFQQGRGRMVGYPEAIADLYPMTSHVVYAASRISSNLKGSTKQFGWLQAPATNISFLSRTSAKPAVTTNLAVGEFSPKPNFPLQRSGLPHLLDIERTSDPPSDAVRSTHFGMRSVYQSA